MSYFRSSNFSEEEDEILKKVHARHFESGRKRQKYTVFWEAVQHDFNAISKTYREIRQLQKRRKKMGSRSDHGTPSHTFSVTNYQQHGGNSIQNNNLDLSLSGSFNHTPTTPQWMMQRQIGETLMHNYIHYSMTSNNTVADIRYTPPPSNPTVQANRDGDVVVFDSEWSDPRSPLFALQWQPIQNVVNSNNAELSHLLTGTTLRTSRPSRPYYDHRAPNDNQQPIPPYATYNQGEGSGQIDDGNDGNAGSQIVEGCEAGYEAGYDEGYNH